MQKDLHTGRIPEGYRKGTGRASERPLKGIRLLFANEMLNNFEVLIEDNNGHRVVGANDRTDMDCRMGWVQERFYKTFRNQFMSRYSLLRTPFLILVPTNALSLNYPQGDFIVI